MSRLRIYKMYEDGSGVPALCEGAVFKSYYHSTDKEHDRFFQALVWANAQKFRRTDTILVYGNNHDHDACPSSDIDKIALINALFGRKLRLYINHKLHTDKYICQGVHS